MAAVAWNGRGDPVRLAHVPAREADFMNHGHTYRDEAERASREPEPAPPPQPPDRLAWASAVGNQAVQRLARSVAVARAPEEEEAAPEEEAPEEEAPEGEAVPEGDEQELPDELPE
jgi:hypothetical protein